MPDAPWRVTAEVKWEVTRFHPPLLNAFLLNLPLVSARFKEKFNRREVLRASAKANAMCWAVGEDSTDAVELLCSWRAEIDALNRLRRMPLSYVNSYNMARLLLDNGAGVNERDGQHGNALQAAGYRGTVSSGQMAGLVARRI